MEIYHKLLTYENIDYYDSPKPQKQFIIISDNKSNGFINNISSDIIDILKINNNGNITNLDETIIYNDCVIKHAIAIFYISFSNDYMISVIKAFYYKCPVLFSNHYIFNKCFSQVYNIDKIWHTNIINNQNYRNRIINIGNNALKFIKSNIPQFISIISELKSNCKNITHNISDIEIFDKPTITLFIQYINDNRRQDEYDFCVQQNINNPYISNIICFHKSNTNIPLFMQNNNKIILINCNDNWMTYKDIMIYASKNYINKICCISNLDIFLEHNNIWETTAIYINKYILCLSRWEYKDNKTWKDAKLSQLLYCHSQDAWVFKGGLIIDCNISIGSYKSNIIFAKHIYDKGIIPINDSSQFKIFHVDNKRNVNNNNHNTVIETELKNGLRQNGNTINDINSYKYYVPDINGINNITIDQLCSQLKLSDIDKYKLKCELLTKYLV